MEQDAFLYQQSSLLITVALFAAIMLLNEIGFRIGLGVRSRADSESKSLTGSVQASILGLLALLLGFTFNMSMQRFDNRSQAVIDEANAIGTAQLRVGLLPAELQGEAAALLARYLELRIDIGRIDVTRQEARARYDSEIADVQHRLWALGVGAAGIEASPVTTGAFVQSLNQMIDAQGRRNALLRMQVPEVVLFLLFTVFIASGGIIGYSGGLTGKRIVVPTLIVSFLISMVVFIIIDLDRPRRGLVQVDQSSLHELRRPPGPV